MAWDANKHVVISSKEIPVSSDLSIIVERYSYDGGSEKIKLMKRKEKRNGEMAHIPMGGIELSDVEKVCEAMIELAKGKACKC